MLKFEIGSRVIAGKCGPGIVNYHNGATLYAVRLDSGKHGSGQNGEWMCTELELSSPPALEEPDSWTAETFHKNPEVREQYWKKSYTYHVCIQLSQLNNLRGLAAISAAIRLLHQYHRDMHVPYEQRDAARREREAARQERDAARQERDTARDEIKRLTRALRHMEEKLKTEQHLVNALEDELPAAAKTKTSWRWSSEDLAKAMSLRWTNKDVAVTQNHVTRTQNFFKCRHWPVSLRNFMDMRTTCTWGCHKYPPRPWANGVYGETTKEFPTGCNS